MQLKDFIYSKLFKEPVSNINIDRKIIINTINPHSYVTSKKDKLFSDALLNSDILLPDGTGIVMASRVLSGNKIKKIAGADIHKYLLNKSNLNSKKIFYLGASESTLQLIKKRLKKEFPNIKVASYSPPFKSEFSQEDTKVMLNAINKFKPNILFVGMTAPKQEVWVYLNKDEIQAKIIVSVGAVFDFYAGTVKRSSDIWIKIGLEWLPRLLREPKRLWRRNFISTPIFLWDVFKEKMS